MYGSDTNKMCVSRLDAAAGANTINGSSLNNLPFEEFRDCEWRLSDDSRINLVIENLLV